MSSIVVPARFNGPPHSANGGYACGLVAAALGSGRESGLAVTLRAPPPLDEQLRIERAGSGVRVLHGDTLVAEGVKAHLELQPPAPVSFEQAVACSVVPAAHPYPTCFVCGPGRDDGLGLYSGPVPGSKLLAAPWTPAQEFARDGAVADEIIWAALDCPGAWTNDRGPALLGRLEAKIASAPKPGERCVVLAWKIHDASERKWLAGTALFGEHDEVHAVARSTWIVPRAL